MKLLFKLPLTAALCAASFAGVSMAHDWYASGSVAWMQQEKSSNAATFSSAFNAGTDGVNPPSTVAAGTALGFQSEFDNNAYSVSGEVGKRLGNGLRGGLELSFAESDLKKHERLAIGGAIVDGADVALLTGAAVPTGTTIGAVLNNGQGQVQNLAAYANAYYDFNRGGALQPYVGAGLGVARVEAEYRPSGVLVGKDTATELAYQVKAGATYHLNENWEVFGEYAYRATEDVSMELDLVPGKLEIENKQQTLGVGLRYRFGG
jgi:opacity protein-like surface antigen